MVLIWQSRNLESLPFMYGPVTDFLVSALTPHVDVIRGSGTKRNHSAAFLGNWSRLGAGDIFIWVGLSMAQAPWRVLGERGVRRILYQTEPVHHCAARRVGNYAVDELWDFSHHNLEACRTARDAPTTLRYVPPGAIEPPPAPEPLAADGSSSRRLFFFGNPRDGKERKACYVELVLRLGQARMEFTFAAFNETSWRDQVLARSGIFVNLHKGCGEAHNPITFRVPKLLNAERLVLSERAHPLDEKEFAGIVSFYDGLPALATAFEQLTRDGSWQAKAREAAARFRVRFAPQRVLRRAGVLELLNASGRRAARHAQRGEVPRGVSLRP